MSDDLLDIGEEKSTDSSILAGVRWWERMRIIYNVIIIGILVTSFFFTRRSYNPNWIMDRAIAFAVFLVIANFAYCLGWGLDVLLRFYFKTKGLTRGLNIAFFVVGTLLVSLFTLLISFTIRW